MQAAPSTWRHHVLRRHDPAGGPTFAPSNPSRPEIARSLHGEPALAPLAYLLRDGVRVQVGELRAAGLDPWGRQEAEVRLREAPHPAPAAAYGLFHERPVDGEAAWAGAERRWALADAPRVLPVAIALARAAAERIPAFPVPWPPSPEDAGLICLALAALEGEAPVDLLVVARPGSAPRLAALGLAERLLVLERTVGATLPGSACDRLPPGLDAASAEALRPLLRAARAAA